MTVDAGLLTADGAMLLRADQVNVLHGGKIGGPDVRIAAQDINIDAGSFVDAKGLGVPAAASANVRCDVDVVRLLIVRYKQGLGAPSMSIAL